MKSARLVAFEALHKIFYDSSYSNIALDSALSNVTEEKAFISALVYGVVERKLTLDYFINKYITSKPKPKIMTILRLGAYQLLFMDKIPSSAAINESVKLVKDIKQDYYSKLVNAVLHKIDEDRNIPDDLSVKYSVPENLINMWKKQYGSDATEQFLPFVNGRPPIFAVPNTRYVEDADELLYELECDGISGEAVEGLVMITSAFDLAASKAFLNGLFHIEDMSSYKCACALQAREGDVVLDMCSAPGGKACTIAQKLNGNGSVYCYDLHAHRLKLIDDTAKRLGIEIIKTAVNDATVFNGEIPKADRILCDVPCSGFGIIRRKPEIRYKSLDSVKELPDLQLKILTASSMYLKSGGLLVYSTCTLNKKENERVVESFLSANSNFKITEEKTFFPSEYGGDGFYYAVLKKNEN